MPTLNSASGACKLNESLSSSCSIHFSSRTAVRHRIQTQILKPRAERSQKERKASHARQRCYLASPLNICRPHSCTVGCRLIGSTILQRETKDPNPNVGSLSLCGLWGPQKHLAPASATLAMVCSRKQASQQAPWLDNGCHNAAEAGFWFGSSPGEAWF